jgi:predicted TPR repeat methyltransferase
MMPAMPADPPAPEAPFERELTLRPEEAFAFAMERHRRAELDDAEMIYAALLERWPDHPDVLSQMGVLQHQRGQSDRAESLLRRALALAPDAAGIWNNLGNVLLRGGRSEDAEQAFRRSVALHDSAEARSNLARLARRRKAWPESEAESRRALEIDADSGDAWHHLSLALIGQGRIADGVAASFKAIVLQPPHRRRRDSYARALARCGELEQAAAMYRQWLLDEPDNAYVRHQLAACMGEPAPGRASDAYVEQVFDDFAASFDEKLARLGYRAPELVAAALADALPAPARQFEIADLGCGTGLCGPLVAPWARRLVGCDLSAGMLAEAERRAVYDELAKAELIAFLDDHPARFDVVISADTLCYFGALDAVAQASARALRDGGLLVFTVEALPDADAAPYGLLVTGRYAHGKDHLRAVLEGAGLRRQRVVAEVLRTEHGMPVHGWLVSASAR